MRHDAPATGINTNGRVSTGLNEKRETATRVKTRSGKNRFARCRFAKNEIPFFPRTLLLFPLSVSSAFTLPVPPSPPLLFYPVLNRPLGEHNPPLCLVGRRRARKKEEEEDRQRNAWRVIAARYDKRGTQGGEYARKRL